ncbi:hypothetical protein PR048_010961 [Dryococelus australis]|uniref:Uncharacterized protein n=1 Tax=Dryococelus australis TaxID=614101 RepID=A0ABQ9HKG6_9NEOP|nr:hypothetical protein PR048_010961 [Dryococelus australis]
MLANDQQENFLTNEKNKTKLTELLDETLTARGIEASTVTGDTDGSIELTFSGSIMFIHSFTGCDTTCAIFNKNKSSILKCFLKMSNGTKAISDIFYDPTSTPDAVAQAGEEMFLTMCQAPPSERDLNNHRYNSLVKFSTKVKANLPSLPPTQCTAKQLSFRVYLQTQQWLNNDSLNPTRWGWVRYDGGVLNPAKTTYPIAPDRIS